MEDLKLELLVHEFFTVMKSLSEEKYAKKKEKTLAECQNVPFVYDTMKKAFALVEEERAELTKV